MDFMRETERLVIRPFNLSYLEEYAREFTAEITKYQFPDPFPDMETANRVMSGFVKEMEEGNMLELVILGQKDEFLGCIDVFGIREETPEVGIWLKRSAHGMGYGYEALGAVVDELNKVGKYRYYTYELDVRNAASVRLVEKFPFEKGDYEEITTNSGKALHSQVYHILPRG